MKFSNYEIPVREENKPKFPVGLKTAYKSGEKVPCRDPFIMPYNGKYYLYKNAREKGIVCIVSDDLKNWSEPIFVFKTPEKFHGEAHFFWAPECHYWNGYFYIFTSVKSKKFGGHRTISAYRADNPLGPFEDIAGGALSPKDWDCIDGTLYVDKLGEPWLVFVHEWTCMPEKNGSMVAAKLSNDFKTLISKPIHLFYAKDPDWAKRREVGVTDGPFLYRADGGELFMIWSNFYVEESGGESYVVALARSQNGELDGPWTQEKILYKQGLRKGMVYDGGHGMIFKKFDGSIALALHTPNTPVDGVLEHLSVMEIKEENGSLTLAD